MANNPKFVPTETPIENYNAGAVNWAYCVLKFDKPKGPSVSQYDPYYMYAVTVNLGGQSIDHIWFVNVDEHIKIQMTGAVKGTVLAAVYVKDGKRKGLVVAYSSGPKQPRVEATVQAETMAAVNALQPANAGGLGAVLPPEQPSFAPPTLPTDPFAPAGAIDPGPPPPVAPTPPVAPPATTPAPPPPAKPAPKQPPQPPAQPQYNTSGRTAGYVPLDNKDFETFKTVWGDNARLHLWGYHTLNELNEELGYPKITAANVRELATSITIETWRQLGRGRNPVKGVYVEVPPVTADTRDGAIELIAELSPANYEIPSGAIREWLGYVAQAHPYIGAWKHAANIADLLGLDSNVLISEWDIDVMLQLTQAIWHYEDKRQEGMDRDSALFLTGQEYDIPTELMKFEGDEPTQ